MADEREKPGETADSPKRHGDKLRVGTEPPVASETTKATGDSPKHQGDKLERAVNKAAKD
jgi:hypothetical protein